MVELFRHGVLLIYYCYGTVSILCCSLFRASALSAIGEMIVQSHTNLDLLEVAAHSSEMKTIASSPNVSRLLAITQKLICYLVKGFYARVDV